jgi:acetyl-CoA acetyltransferase
MVELLVPIFADLWEQTGWTKSDIGFWCSGSSDYLAGRSFSFVSAVDAIGTIPPVNESHVEMDAAWALYEAWLKIQSGEVDTALVYGFGKSSAGTLRRVMSLQMDPYVGIPLWPDAVSVAGLQARAGIDAGLWDEKAMASVVSRNLGAGKSNPFAVRAGDRSEADLLASPMYADPLHKHDCAPVTDGASAIILAAGDKARSVASRPAWITGFEHRIDGQNLGLRDITTSPSLAKAGAALDLTGVDLAELHAPFSHQELIATTALGLGDDITLNPSGGALCANAMFAGGLIRIGEAARRVLDGTSDKALAHATSGPLLQQNILCLMEGRN